jgi:MFS family permease
MKHTPYATKTIAILAFSQVLSWGALYYAIAILAPEIQKEMGWRNELVFGAFSWCLLVAGVVSTPIGIMLDKHGGRAVMGLGSLICGSGLILLSMAHHIASYFLAWSILGLAMGMTLYEAAFATITHHFGVHARQAISTLTLFGGFASTVFWPLTLKLNIIFGWRETYLIYGVAQIVLCYPLHLMLEKRAEKFDVSANADKRTVRNHTLREAIRHPAFWKLALAFATNSFSFSALAVHLIPLLQQYGHTAVFAVGLAAIVGPMQVAGRIGEMTLARNILPQTVGKFAFSALPAAILVLLLFGVQHWAVALFCVFYGLSNGIITIVRGTIPQALFGRENYGAISGAMAGPALVAKAAGPIVLAALIQITASPSIVVGSLLLFSVASLLLYLQATKQEVVTPSENR